MSQEPVQDALYDEGAFAALRRDAEAGRLEAMTAVGDRLLIGREAPFEPQAGLGFLASAAERGSAEALNRMATLASAGAWIPQSFSDAFAFLSRAAGAGSRNARTQLLLLCEDEALATRARSGEDAPEVWRGLADSISVSTWTTPHPRRAVSEAPRIRVADGFLKPDICDWLVEKARGKLKPALIFDGKVSAPHPMRTNSDYVFDLVAADVVVTLVRLRISATTHLPVQAFEPSQVFHYAVGQELKAHYDHVRDSLSYHGVSASEGERIATFLIYLNDDYEGGQTEFTKVGFSFKGKKGDGFFFANVTPEGKPDPLSLHAGRPVTHGEKWMFSQWIQDRPVFKAA